ncbi:MAG: polysaccharide biosynthesis protein [Candidatus Niyogibacteria bacterium RIFCSPLOWO2_01_FULL_45_48]|uniref:Polysaccharide biosynthesis protein n=2 Tax=Candidatus Niyogiibacteriota TaxID=1817912 RepID=A0A1G2F051_9BACT|nr:MAG: polysaccharide biosynthesis protein [Candidatus Niyogibacteria bacterium RIFCSPHIGHO2_01_FULL_45_28]OGZ31103.1 MAG: polysaccharide biosynthesis protein [Candidatus Niyogibacteria bacterium RIFCSPLOWO2_01_FULL_45_48]OGZ31486.1 MAG: polysaccharide biosynthesis protein [Candidatus Niyogibacteria bacterium RIFCSPLOWO2_02_FULL_45_13]
MAKPYIDEEEEKLVLEVLRSGTLSIGPKIEEFEKRFSEMLGVKYASAVSSGTAALHLALIALGIKEGDEVITSPFSFVASANAILYMGAKPVFADVDPLTFNMDPKEAEKKITPKTKAILPVHIFGQSCGMRPITELAKRHNLKVIEDACESIMAEHKGQKVGTFGDAAAFSFYPNKQMTTGEGGMIVTNDEKIDSLCRSLRNQGRAQNMQWLDHQMLGYNYRITEMGAALGIGQLKKLAGVIEKRREIAGWYEEEIKKYDDLLIAPETHPDNTHTWFLYVARIKNPQINRDEVIKKMAEFGIATKPYLPSIHLFDFYRKGFGFKEGDFPVSEAISSSSVALPFYIGLEKSDTEYICRKLAETVKGYKIDGV